MTPEQKQQLEQVREQQAAHSALFDAHDSYKIVQRSEIRTMLNSIDFLLSLVKSQEEDYALVDKYLAELKQELGLPPNAHASISLDRYKERVANSMRSACVEKVKVLRDEWEAKRNTSEPLSKLRNRYDAAFCAANEILTQLESLSIEKLKE